VSHISIHLIINKTCDDGFMLVGGYAPGFSTRLVKTRCQVRRVIQETWKLVTQERANLQR
jgi:hypothetical protein